VRGREGGAGGAAASRRAGEACASKVGGARREWKAGLHWSARYGARALPGAGNAPGTAPPARKSSVARIADGWCGSLRGAGRVSTRVARGARGGRARSGERTGDAGR